MRKPKTPKQRFVFVLITIGVYALLALLFVIAFIPMVINFFLVQIPIIRAVQTEPLYWLTWKEVKCKSGKSTASVLQTLYLYSVEPNPLFDCQWRDEKDVLLLERLLKRKRPKQDYPVTPRQVLFFRYRLRGSGTPKWSLTRMLPNFGRLLPAPVRVT